LSGGLLSLQVDFFTASSSLPLRDARVVALAGHRQLPRRVEVGECVDRDDGERVRIAREPAEPFVWESTADIIRSADFV